MSTLTDLFNAIPGQWEKVIATVALIAIGMLFSHLWARYLSRGEISAEKRRLHLVWARNVIWFMIFTIVVSVWASTIAGFALSLAAVAGAMLIVSKELLMCVLGYLYITLVRPFKVGDLIEINQLNGRVIDIDMFATTLAELGYAGQLTGKVAEFPNGMLLTTPLKNTSPTGEYVLHLFRMPLPEGAAHDLDQVEAAALAAADEATQSWQAEAEAHFRKISDESFIAFPSARSKVLWDFSDPKQLMLVVRIACPAQQRLKVEQFIFRETWRALSQGKA
ncbi:MAG: mechanosensitive ion channel family protein [Dechloromonas sp.]|nr:mechanosensitive ion channel family protein [Dechloromonas sp.]